MDSKETFLALIRLGIGHQATIPTDFIDWQAIQVIAAKQGLSAIVFDGIEKIRVTNVNWKLSLPSDIQLTHWIGVVSLRYEYRYELYCRAIAELAHFYNSHGINMMVLKGYSCSLDWPIPDHRPSGDIDIWLFGKQKEADVLLAKEMGVKIDSTHHHHTLFCWKDFIVENHYDFTNIYAHTSSRTMEKVFKKMGEERKNSIELNGEIIYLPSVNLNALFLLRHMLIHFVSNKMNLRQLMDWGFFIKKHIKEIDCKWLNEILDKFHMKVFFDCINAICIENLGFHIDDSLEIWVNSKMNNYEFKNLKERILNDIISPEFCDEKPTNFLSRIVYKYRRWNACKWKHQLCFNESLWSGFLSSIWSHFLKPNSI